jgi:hypothetical protein
MIIMRKRLNGINVFHILRGGLLSAAGTLVMSAAVFAIFRILPEQPAWLLTISGITAGGLAYGLSMAVLRVPELDMLLNAIRRRIIKN